MRTLHGEDWLSLTVEFEVGKHRLEESLRRISKGLHVAQKSSYNLTAFIVGAFSVSLDDSFDDLVLVSEALEFVGRSLRIVSLEPFDVL